MRQCRAIQKELAILFSWLLLLQSCVAYKRTPATVEEAMSPANSRMKLITGQGDVYKVNWIQANNDSISSITNTDQVFLNRNQVQWIKQDIPDGKLMDVNTALEYKGDILLHKKGFTYEFIQFYESGDQLVGIQPTGGKNQYLKFHERQIRTIYLQDKAGSAGLSVLAAAGIFLVTAGFIGLSSMEIPMDFSQ